jgi:hypothetical protein
VLGLGVAVVSSRATGQKVSVCAERDRRALLVLLLFCRIHAHGLNARGESLPMRIPNDGDETPLGGKGIPRRVNQIPNRTRREIFLRDADKRREQS